MVKEDATVMVATFWESLANTKSKIQIAGGHCVLAHIPGRSCPGGTVPVRSDARSRHLQQLVSYL